MADPEKSFIEKVNIVAGAITGIAVVNENLPAILSAKDQAYLAALKASEAATSAAEIKALSVEASTLLPSAPATATYDPLPGKLSIGVPKGDTGNQGLQGIAGADGANGISAYQVALNNGFAGTEAEWVASLKGEQGLQGLQGEQGLQGVSGADGVDGANGISAYQVAINNGFAGTEAEWIASLKGEQGLQGVAGADGTMTFADLTPDQVASLKGEQGLQGVAGADGADGANGISAYQVAINNGFVGTEAEWIASLKGEQGLQGISGADGADGLSAYQVVVNNGYQGTEAEWAALMQSYTNSGGSIGSLPPYHLLSGSLTLSNDVITVGYGTYVYTGNTATPPSVNLGMDIQSQWGNDISETYGYIINFKSRNAVGDWTTIDSIRGTTKYVSSNTTAIEGTDANIITLNTVAGETTVTMGSSTRTNSNTVTYVMEVFQLTHRFSGITNHNKPYTSHYNPFMGTVALKHEGSGVSGHEMPTHLNRELGLWHIRRLDLVTDWASQYKTSTALNLNLTNAEGAISVWAIANTAGTLALGSHAGVNASASQHIMYGYSNSYFDESNVLIGNYELVTWQGTGAVGNKVITKGKPAAILSEKRLDLTGNWNGIDIVRGAGTGANPYLQLNNSNAEASADLVDVVSDGFIFTSTNAEFNALGGQYMALVVYDNDSGSGKSKYPRANDTSTLNLNATIPFPNGTNNTVLTKNETITGLALTHGKNYVYAKNNGLYGVTPAEPQYLRYNGFGDYFDVKSNQWYQSPSMLSDNFKDGDYTSWTIFGGGTTTLSVANSRLAISVTTEFDGVQRSFPTVVGKKYRFLFDCQLGSATKVRMFTDAAASIDISNTFSGEYTMDFIATATTTVAYILSGATTTGTFSVSDIAIYPINDDGSVDITAATPIAESRNYLDAVVYADAGGQPTYVEQLPRAEYKKDLEVKNLVVTGVFDLVKTMHSPARLLGATYYNTSGREKWVSVSITYATAPFQIQILVDGDVVGTQSTAGTGLNANIATMVPVGSSYKAVVVTGTGTLSVWSEVY